MRPDVQKGQLVFGLSRGLPAPQGSPSAGRTRRPYASPPPYSSPNPANAANLATSGPSFAPVAFGRACAALARPPLRNAPCALLGAFLRRSDCARIAPRVPDHLDGPPRGLPTCSQAAPASRLLRPGTFARPSPRPPPVECALRPPRGVPAPFGLCAHRSRVPTTSTAPRGLPAHKRPQLRACCVRALPCGTRPAQSCGLSCIVMRWRIATLQPVAHCPNKKCGIKEGVWGGFIPPTIPPKQ